MRPQNKINVSKDSNALKPICFPDWLPYLLILFHPCYCNLIFLQLIGAECSLFQLKFLTLLMNWAIKIYWKLCFLCWELFIYVFFLCICCFGVFLINPRTSSYVKIINSVFHYLLTTTKKITPCCLTFNSVCVKFDDWENLKFNGVKSINLFLL